MDGKKLSDLEILVSLREAMQSPLCKLKSIGDALTVIKLTDQNYAGIIEVGFAGSNELTEGIIKEAVKVYKEGYLNATVGAFGMIRKPNTKVDDYERNPHIKSLLDVETPVVVLVYKSWDYSVEKILGTDTTENLRMLTDTIKFFKDKGKEVIVDAEFASNAFLGKPNEKIDPNLDYLLRTIEHSSTAGASRIVLCDTTGILLEEHINPLVSEALKVISPHSIIGYHGHNDQGTADALTHLAMAAGAKHLQVSPLGLGERCGNASDVNLLIYLTSPYKKNPLKLDLTNLKKNSELVYFFLTGKQLPPNTIGVGRYAFTHKGGMHTDATVKDEGAYNGRKPAEFGNEASLVLSLQSGRGHIAQLLGVPKKNPWVAKVYAKAMELEGEGYSLDEYPDFFNLFAARLKDDYKPPFEVGGYTIDEKIENGKKLDSASVEVFIGGKIYAPHAESEHGEVDAAIKAISNLIKQHYKIPNYRLNYSVVSLSGEESSQKVLVHASFILDNGKYPTVYTMPYISSSVTEASIRAITNGIEYALIIGEAKGKK